MKRLIRRVDFQENELTGYGRDRMDGMLLLLM